jgi:hypothetical protein
MNTDKFIKMAIEKHKYKYDYSKVNYINNRIKVIIICPKHDEFLQLSNPHLAGHGCPKCKIDTLSNLYRSTGSIFIEKAKSHIKHKDKNYDYSKVNYINSRTPIIIICPIHGEFSQTPSSHLQGNGCKHCGIKLISNILRRTTIEFIEKSNILHNNKYDYSKVNYINDNIKVNIICPKHGEFLQMPGSHLNGHGCRKCSFEYIGNLLKSSTPAFIVKSNIIHNNKYDYSKVNYINDRIKVIIICPVHGEFLQSPNYHLNGGECLKCVSNLSKMSIEWLNMIKVSVPHLRTYHSLEGEYRIPNTHYYADGYDEKTNTIYEFHGDYWHGNPKIYNQNDINPSTKSTYGELYTNTINKKNICISLGFKYIEIWEYNWKKFKTTIIKKQKQIKNI